MKIAVPVTSENQIDGHFGHCEMYGVYTISANSEITDKKKINSPEGCGCKSDIAATLARDEVKIMLADGIGAGAINVLNNSGIEVVRSCSGDADEAVKLFLSGFIHDSGSSCRQHESHNREGHVCGHN